MIRVEDALVGRRKRPAGPSLAARSRKRCRLLVSTADNVFGAMAGVKWVGYRVGVGV